MGDAGGWAEMWEIESGSVGGVDGVAVGKKDGDAGVGECAVEVRRSDVDEVPCAAGVGDA